jgi:hypothetical protein
MAPNGAMVTLGISSTNGNGNVNCSGVTRNGGTVGSGGIIRGGGVGASISTWGPLFAFNPIVEFFHELQQNYQGLRIEKLQRL